MYAIFRAKGKQFRAEPEKTIRIPSLDAEPGETVTFDEILLAEDDGEVHVGRPTLEGGAIAAEVVEHGKGEKVIVFKRKKRKNYRRKQGHRQPYTEIRVVDIDLGEGGPSAETAAEVAPEEAVEAPEAGEEPEAETAEEAEPVRAEEEQGLTAEDVDITDAARELADEHGIDITTLDGTGKDGRILKADVQEAVKAQEDYGE
ncbi:MAG: 50S ribosomal protein L21 [Gemmatimonadota bacterium]